MASVYRTLLHTGQILTTTTDTGVSMEPINGNFIGWLRISAINGATTATAVIQHSADNANWVDLISFTAAVGVTSTQAMAVESCLGFVRSKVTLAGATQDATLDVVLYSDKKSK